jgi:hypothetical protein
MEHDVPCSKSIKVASHLHLLAITSPSGFLGATGVAKLAAVERSAESPFLKDVHCFKLGCTINCYHSLVRTWLELSSKVTSFKMERWLGSFDVSKGIFVVVVGFNCITAISGFFGGIFRNAPKNKNAALTDAPTYAVRWATGCQSLVLLLFIARYLMLVQTADQLRLHCRGRNSECWRAAPTWELVHIPPVPV